MPKRYRVGIDVGLRSVGLAAIEIDDSDDNPYGAIPMKLLSVMSVIHDGGIDPDNCKQDLTRKNCSGAARRARHLRKRRANRLSELDKVLMELGYDVAREDVLDLVAPNDPYYPWRLRAEAARGYISNEAERSLAIVVSVRSVARHRGWRNPYSSTTSLGVACEKPSSFYEEFVSRLVDGGLISRGSYDVSSEWRLTPSELVEAAGLLCPLYAFRTGSENGKENKDSSANDSRAFVVPLGKLHQSDYWQELRKIFKAQRVPEEHCQRILELVFAQVNPKDTGAAAKLVAHDDLPGQEKYIRASKASPTFQRYRILTTIANLSIRQDGKKRQLTSQERKAVYKYLTSEKSTKDQPSWHDVAQALSVDRSELVGVGGQTEDGDPISAKEPPVLQTEALLRKKKKDLQPILDWWPEASQVEQELFVELAGNAGVDGASLCPREQRALQEVDDFMATLDETVLTALESLELPSGRAAYSVDSMMRLNERMLNDSVGLHEARALEFGVDDSWTPSPEPLGTPMGNPSVDRTIRIVSRWLNACVKKWGTPETVNIEHVRDGFSSVKQSHDRQKEMNSRYKGNQAVRSEIKDSVFNGKEADVSKSDIRRYQAIQRQNGQCAYCGREINYSTAEMDHIVPRKGAGSTNNRANLVATCRDCNSSKSNTLFSAWATEQQMNETIQRVRYWIYDKNTFPTKKAFSEYKRDVISRLRQTVEDEPIDSRSMESVAWMARALASQIEGFMRERGASLKGENTVHVYKGLVTAEARLASGLEGRLPWIGGASRKTRLDRRHHAVDAAVIAVLRPAVCQVLVERSSMHRAHDDMPWDKKFANWKTYCGDAEHKNTYLHWRDCQMESLCELLIRAMDNDFIIVTNPLRLGLSRGSAHKETIQKCVTIRLGEKMSAAAIDKVASAATWTALTRLPDYSAKDGLPEDSGREIVVHGERLDARNKIQFMSDSMKDLQVEKDAILTPVRGGFAVAGNAIHHARVYAVSSRGSVHYKIMRIISSDLTRCHGDLFSYEIPESAPSFRFADKALKRALVDGEAKYLGWIVVGDELVINPSAGLFDPSGSNAINKFMRAFPGTKRFKVTGFPQKTKVAVEVLQMASEGLPDLDSIEDKKARARAMQRTYGYDDWSSEDIGKIRKAFGLGAGLLLGVDVLFSTGVTVLRRSALGYPRWENSNGMPMSWSTK